MIWKITEDVHEDFSSCEEVIIWLSLSSMVIQIKHLLEK